MTTHSSILAWRIPWTGEPGGLLSMESHRVRHDWSDLACMHACIEEGNGNPLQCSCLENPRDRGAWWVAVCGVAQSRTWLMRFSSSSNIQVIQDNLPISMSLTSADLWSPCHVRWHVHRLWVLGCEHLWVVIIQSALWCPVIHTAVLGDG